jgi:hypothetical protein
MTFTVQPDWKVLVLEDAPQRIVWFKERVPDAVYVATAVNLAQDFFSPSDRIRYRAHGCGHPLSTFVLGELSRCEDRSSDEQHAFAPFIHTRESIIFALCSPLSGYTMTTGSRFS